MRFDGRDVGFEGGVFGFQYSIFGSELLDRFDERAEELGVPDSINVFAATDRMVLEPAEINACFLQDAFNFLSNQTVVVPVAFFGAVFFERFQFYTRSHAQFEIWQSGACCIQIF